MPTLFLEGSGPKWGTGKRRTEQVQYVFFLPCLKQYSFRGFMQKSLLSGFVKYQCIFNNFNYLLYVYAANKKNITFFQLK